MTKQIIINIENQEELEKVLNSCEWIQKKSNSTGTAYQLAEVIKRQLRDQE